MKVIDFIPPILLNFYLNHIKKSGWSGNYATWESAAKKASGYDSEGIFNQVKEATEAVINGKAAFEKDGVLFYEAQYNWPVLSSLLFAQQELEEKLSVVDFGGALGSIYYQHQKFLNAPKVKWNILEQSEFVKLGKASFEQSNLKFFHNLKECQESEKTNTLLIACVLQYLEKPHHQLEELLKGDFEFIVLDRLALSHTDTDRITVQHVPKSIYQASYPAWFFSKSRILKHFKADYELIYEYPSEEKPNNSGYFAGLVFRKK